MVTVIITMVTVIIRCITGVDLEKGSTPGASNGKKNIALT